MTINLIYKGFDYVDYYNGGYANADSLSSLAGTGANAVSANTEYGIDPQSDTVYADSNYTESLTQVGATIQEAVAQGDAVMVRPLIDFLNSSDLNGTNYSIGDWRSDYNPGAAGSAGANTFFASYKTMVLNYAQVAAANGATSICIGTELDQITGASYKSYWDSIISAVHTQDPTLKLTYAADWDDDQSPWAGVNGLAAGTGNLATQVSFASELDSIGIDNYAPISNAADPTVAQLVTGWTQAPDNSGATAETYAVTGGQSLIAYYEGVAAAVGKPLTFTELGYENATDADTQPAYTSTGSVDDTLQSNLYQAFFQAWQQSGNSSLTGVYIWNWDPNASEVGPGNGTNFSPQGLEAQTTIAGWYTTSFSGGGYSINLTDVASTQISVSDTNQTWDTVSGDGGSIIAVNAQANIIGGSDTVDFEGASGNVVELYGTNGNWDAVYGSDAETALNDAQANVIGGSNTVDFEGSSGNVVELYGTNGNWDAVYGSDAETALNNAQSNVIGGSNTVDFEGSSGNVVELYGTNGDWDAVYGSYAETALNNAQSNVIGGSNTVDFEGSSGNIVELYGTDGAADSVVGSSGVVALNTAQAAISGGADTIVFASASGNHAELLGTGGQWDSVMGSDGAVGLAGAQANVTGGANSIFFDPGAQNIVELYQTENAWDQVAGSGGTVALNNSQANVTGGGNTVDLEGTSGNVVELYGTSGNADAINGSNGTIALNASQADVSGSNDIIDFEGTSGSTATASGNSETAAFIQPAFGQDTFSGFNTSDTLQFSASDFSNFAALQSHLSQSGSNAVITLGSNSVTLTNVTAGNLTQSEFHFS